MPVRSSTLRLLLRGTLAAAAAAAPPALAQDIPRLVIPPPPLIVPPPPGLSPDIRAMIETAIDGGDEGTARNVLAVAKKVSPEHREEIEAIEKRWKADLAARRIQAEKERLEQLRGAGPFDNWKGNVEFGAYRSTGTSSNLGVVGSIELERKSIAWTQKLSARADLQQTDGETSTERLTAAWQPSYRFDKSTYAFGLAQYEHDPFAGYDNRYTLGGGLGYHALAGSKMQLDLEGGPVLRHTDEIEGFSRSRLAGRGSLNLRWQLTPTLKLSQQTAIYLESEDSNATATTAIDSKVIGNLQARFSYNVQYEGNTPPGTDAFNTQSRVTFIYGF